MAAIRLSAAAEDDLLARTDEQFGAAARRPRHLLLYRVLRPRLIGVGRVLHDAMDLEGHWPSDLGVIRERA